MPEPPARLTALLSLAMVLIGVLMIVRTLSAGGGALAVGLILGGLFVVLGVARLSMTRVSR